jgi:hypothetical protein
MHIEALGLKDFKIYWEHTNDMPNSYAFIRPDIEAMQAVIGLTINFGEHKVSRSHLDYCARHEVLHLLLADLVQVGKYRQSMDIDFTRAQHAIIRRLENWN